MASPLTLRSGLTSTHPKLLSDMTDNFLEAKNKGQTSLRLGKIPYYTPTHLVPKIFFVFAVAIPFTSWLTLGHGISHKVRSPNNQV